MRGKRWSTSASNKSVVTHQHCSLPRGDVQKSSCASKDAGLRSGTSGGILYRSSPINSIVLVVLRGYFSTQQPSYPNSKRSKILRHALPIAKGPKPPHLCVPFACNHTHFSVSARALLLSHPQSSSHNERPSPTQDVWYHLRPSTCEMYVQNAAIIDAVVDTSPMEGREVREGRSVL